MRNSENRNSFPSPEQPSVSLLYHSCRTRGWVHARQREGGGGGADFSQDDLSYF